MVQALKLTEELGSVCMMNEAYKTSALNSGKGLSLFWDSTKYPEKVVLWKTETLRKTWSDNMEFAIATCYPFSQLEIVLSLQTMSLAVLSHYLWLTTPHFTWCSHFLRRIRNSWKYQLGVENIHGQRPETSWNWIKEATKILLMTVFQGDVWKFDKSRGLLKESRVRTMPSVTMKNITLGIRKRIGQRQRSI